MRIGSFPWLRIVAFSAIASVAIYGASCSSSETHGTGGAGGESSELADVIYEGEATDEGLEALLAVTPLENPPKVAIFDTPPENTQLPASPIPTFTWHVEASSTSRAPAPAGAPASKWALGDVLRGFRAPRAALGPFLELVGAERSAAAHGAPLNGAAYLLVFTTAGNDKLLRVFTTKLTYTPDAAAWAKLKGAGAPIEAWILTGIFDSNTVAADGGPFKGPWIGFTVGS